MEVTPMSAFLTAIASVVNQLMSLASTVGTSLLTNTLFQVVFGIGIAYTVTKIFKRLVRI